MKTGTQKSNGLPNNRINGHDRPCHGDTPPSLWGVDNGNGDGVVCQTCHAMLAAPETAAERDLLKEQLALMNTRTRYDAVAWDRDEKIRSELLAALEQAFIALGHNGANMKDGSYRGVWLQARAAIAKAKGRGGR